MKRALIGGMVLASFALASAVWAQTAWDGGGSPDNSWFNGDNWTAGVPESTTNVTINGAAYHAVVDSGNAVLQNFTLTAGTLTIEPGRVFNASRIAGSTIGTGFTVNIAGGTFTGTQSANLDITLNGTLKITGDGQFIPAAHNIHINGGNVLLGDTVSGGVYDPSRATRANSASVFRGWGTVRHGGWADNWFYGTMIADGWGSDVDRELRFEVKPASLNYQWRMGGNTSAPYDKGWFAVNRSQLTLSGLRFTSAITQGGWGSQFTDSANNPTMVNSLWMDFDSITHTGTKYVAGSLLSLDHSQVAGYSIPVNGGVSSVYAFTPDPDFAFSGPTTFTFRYDDVALGAAAEPYLSLWHFDPTANLWKDIANLPGYSVVVNDAVGVKQLQVIGFSGIDSISGMFLLGHIVSPEPGTLVMAALALLLVGKRRARQ